MIKTRKIQKSISMSNYRVMYDNNNLTKAEKLNSLNRFHYQLTAVHTWIENVNLEKDGLRKGQPDPTPRDPREPSRSEPRKANRIHAGQPDRTTLIIAAGGEESKCCAYTQTRACHETREHLFTPSGATFSFGCSAAITQGRRDAPTWMQQAEETDGGKKPVLSTCYAKGPSWFSTQKFCSIYDRGRTLDR